MRARLIFPHQLFVEHFDCDRATLMVLVEHDLLFRQYPFHRQKLVLHRSSMRSFADELAQRGFEVAYVETDADQSTQAQLEALLTRRAVTSADYFDVVDDWLQQSIDRTLGAAGVAAEDRETPGFLTTRADLTTYFANRPRRMQQFYEWQRRRLDILVDGGQPVGGRWSYDTENRKKLPKGVDIPALPWPRRTAHTTDAIAWVAKAFPDNPGDADAFSWPTERAQADRWLEDFLDHRFELFGPYEDAIAEGESYLFHGALSALLNTGLLDPRDVVDKALTHADRNDIPLSSVEGFVRQVIGWREYMRATYAIFGRRMRSQNSLGLTRAMPAGFWDGTTGLRPVDDVVRRIDRTAYAHHIERLMVLGNAMLLLRVDPDEVYEWFMTLFIDAYDWVMVPNVYAMSQFATRDLITTKPYVSASSYLRRMSNFGTGPWRDAWDALFWQFVADYRDVFADNHRSAFMTRQFDGFDDAKKKRLHDEAMKWLAT